MQADSLPAQSQGKPGKEGGQTSKVGKQTLVKQKGHGIRSVAREQHGQGFGGLIDLGAEIKAGARVSILVVRDVFEKEPSEE